MTVTPGPGSMMTQTPAQPVVATVTGKDLLDQLGGLHDAVTTLTAKVEDLPARVRALEAWRWKAVGAAALFSSLLSGGLVGIIAAAVHH